MKHKKISLASQIFLASLLCTNLHGHSTSQGKLIRDRENRNWTLTRSYQTGNVYNKLANLSGTGSGSQYENSFKSYSLQFGKQTNGDKAWHVAHNYPTFGGGIDVFDFYAPRDLGTPIVIYGFISSALKRWERFSIRYELDVGVSFNWRPYDAAKNPNNKAIGSKINAYLGGGTFLEYRVTRSVSASAGINFNHFSCGSTVQPNAGINIISPKINVKYNLSDHLDVFNRPNSISFQKKYELILGLFTSVKNYSGDKTKVDSMVFYNRTDYRIYGLTANITRQVNYLSKIGLGLSLSYDNASNEKLSNSSWEKDLQLSVYPSYEFVFSNLSINIQPGIYLYRNRSCHKTPRYYQRIGMKYHVMDNVFFGVNLRAYNFAVADYIEWTIGYRIEWSNS